MQLYSFTLASLMNIEELQVSLENLSILGFDKVDMYGEPEKFKNKPISKDIFSSFNLKIDGITGMWGKLSPNSWKRRLLSNDIAFLKYSEKYIKDCIDMCAKLEANKFNVCLFSDPNYSFDPTHNYISNTLKKKSISKVFPIINELIRYANDNNVNILIEPLNRYSTPFCTNLDDAIFIMDNCENCKLLLDTFHMNIEEDSIEKTILEAKNYLFQIHFAENNRKMPGYGHIDFFKIMQSLKKISFNNTISFEPTISKQSDYNRDIKHGIEYIKNIESLLK